MNWWLYSIFSQTGESWVLLVLMTILLTKYFFLALLDYFINSCLFLLKQKKTNKCLYLTNTLFNVFFFEWLVVSYTLLLSFLFFMPLFCLLTTIDFFEKKKYLLVVVWSRVYYFSSLFLLENNGPFHWFYRF